MPDGEAKDLFPLPFDLPVIVLTATYDVNLAVTLMKLGVDDFLVKDKDMQFIKLLPEKINSVVEKKEDAERNIVTQIKGTIPRGAIGKFLRFCREQNI